MGDILSGGGKINSRSTLRNRLNTCLILACIADLIKGFINPYFKSVLGVNVTETLDAGSPQGDLIEIYKMSTA